MKFYLCQTPNGPQLAGTQADAKKLDPNYETVEYATDKDALMERLNALMRRASGIQIDDAPATAADVTAIGAEMDAEDGGHPQDAPTREPKAKNFTSATNWSYGPPVGSCERCMQMSDAARIMEGIMVITNVEYAIMHFNEKYLVRVDEYVADRRKVLAEAAA